MKENDFELYLIEWLKVQSTEIGNSRQKACANITNKRTRCLVKEQ